MKEKQKPFPFESEDQLIYAATCLSASNLGFDILNERDFIAKRWIPDIQRSTSYKDKANSLVYDIANLSEEGVDMYRAVLDERKEWVSFLKKEGTFNDKIQQYISIAQGN